MGYDISFHPISEEQIQAWYFDVIGNHHRAREIAKVHGVDKEGEDFYENKYIEMLTLGKEATAEEDFDNTHGYYIANVQGIFEKYFYLRGAAFSFIASPLMEPYYKKWEEIIPNDYRDYTIENKIVDNYYSGKFIPYSKVCQLLEDYANNEEIKTLLNKEFLSAGVEIIIEALHFAKEQGVGLLEADGVMEPNPLDLNESTCYSNLFNCDIKGPLLYEKIAKKQMDAFAKESDVDIEDMEKKMLRVEYEVEEEDEDDGYHADELWYDEEEYDKFYEEGIELYGLNELDLLLDEIDEHNILKAPWYKRLRLFFFRGKQLKEAETTALKMKMLFMHHDFENIEILDKEETAEYAKKVFHIAKGLNSIHFEISIMLFSAYMMIGKSSFFLWFWIFIFGLNLKRALDSFSESKEVTLWYDRLMSHLESMDNISQKEVDSSIAEIKEKLTPYAKEMISITPQAEKPAFLWSSKFGGHPYWTKERDYPANAKGNPLYMIAQLNFAEMPDLEGYPKEGILQFFIADDNLLGLTLDKNPEEIFKDPQGYRVIYHEKVVKDEALLEKNLPTVNENSSMPLTKAYALKFIKKEEFPSPSDCMYEVAAGDIYDYSDDVVDTLWEEVCNDGSKLGGYANFAQEDPRYGMCKKWQLLFQMDSDYDEDIEIMWGDSGVANFFIEPEHLKVRDFSRVLYNWDCH